MTDRRGKATLRTIVDFAETPQVDSKSPSDAFEALIVALFRGVPAAARLVTSLVLPFSFLSWSAFTCDRGRVQTADRAATRAHKAQRGAGGLQIDPNDDRLDDGGAEST